MDRLSSLIARFRMRVEVASLAQANLHVFASASASASAGSLPERLVFWPEGPIGSKVSQACLGLRVEWAGAHNPLVAALPERVEIALHQAPQIATLLFQMQQELATHRCGAETVLSSLGQAVMVRLLRHLIEAGTAEPGLLAGLSDLRLARAIVAMHDHPGRLWTTRDLAVEAGLSLSRFSELFAAQVGETPISYLRRWRLTLARQDLIRGDRVEAVARRYAYESPEGFTRAFRKAYGIAPISLRRAVA